LVDGSVRAELSFGPLPSLWGEARQKLIGKAHAKNVWPFTRWVDAITHREGPRDWVSGACLLVRRTDAEAVGLLDERFFLYWEDADFCAALRARGRGVWFTPAAEVVHLRGRSSAGVRPATNTAYRRGQLAFYRKWRPRWAPLVAAYLRARGQHPDRTAE
jgi:GT2 family glycosyltransferase